METGIGTSTLRSLGRRASLSTVTSLLEAAVASGARTIDTADIYGAGSAERAVSTAFRRSAALRAAQVRVITKGGYDLVDLPRPLHLANQPFNRLLRLRARGQRFEESALRSAWRGSRRRLAGVPVYAYCLHNPPAEVLLHGDAVRVLASLRDAGAFQRVGVSVDDDGTAALLAGLTGVDLVQMPATSYLRLGDEVRGVLRWSGTEVVVNRVSAVGQGTAGGIAVLAALEQGPDVAVIGTRDPAHVRENAAAARLP